MALPPSINRAHGLGSLIMCDSGGDQGLVHPLLLFRSVSDCEFAIPRLFLCLSAKFLSVAWQHASVVCFKNVPLLSLIILHVSCCTENFQTRDQEMHNSFAESFLLIALQHACSWRGSSIWEKLIFSRSCTSDALTESGEVTEQPSFRLRVSPSSRFSIGISENCSVTASKGHVPFRVGAE